MKLIRMAVCAALLAVCAVAQTTVADTVNLVPGVPYDGQITITWPAFTTADGRSVAKGRTYTTVAGGVLNVTLWPTVGATPAVVYTAAYVGTSGPTQGIQFAEKWNVPASPSVVALSDVRKSSTLSGNTILNGADPPANTIGVDGDFYIQIPLSGPRCMYGPKASNAWPGSCFTMTAPTVTAGTVTTGAAGSSAAVTNSGTATNAIFDFTIPRGEAGNTVLNGAGTPSNGTGVNGDFYVNTTTWCWYGPKTGGAWGECTELTGLGYFPASVNGTTTITVATHGLGLYPTVVECADSDGNVWEPGGIAINGSGDVTISGISAMVGTCKLMGSPGSHSYVAAVSGTLVTVTAAMHHLPAPTLAACYDTAGEAYTVGPVSRDLAGTVTIRSTYPMSGVCILR